MQLATSTGAENAIEEIVEERYELFTAGVFSV
jgi:hypothetical protein